MFIYSFIFCRGNLLNIVRQDIIEKVKAYYLNSYIDIYVYKCVCIYIYIYICVCVCVCVYYLFIYIYMYVCTYVCIHIFILQRVKARAIPCPHQPPTRGDNTVLVAQGDTATPGATKQFLPPERAFKRIIYIYIRKIT